MRSKPNRKKTYGTREWAAKNVNFCTGCRHNCRYCYARGIAVRFKRLIEAQWPNEIVRQHDVNKGRRKKYEGWIMTSSSHDITPGNLAGSLIVLEKLLKIGNRVLIVSKPHLDCIREICQQFEGYRDRILFRFTIGSCDDRVLSFWEPGAPRYAERLASLRYAHENGFQTSVSVEPMLDSANIDQLITEVLLLVTETIWIGKMNHLGRLSKNADARLLSEIQRIEAGQTDAIIWSIYQRHKGNPQIRWKDSIRKVVRLALVP